MTKRSFPLNRFGYITRWLLSGPYSEPVDPSTRTIVDQQEYERYLCRHSYDGGMQTPPQAISLGEPGLNGIPWRFYAAGENIFVDANAFYFSVEKCELWASTVLVSPREQTVQMDIYSFTGLDIWVNDQRIFTETECGYAPMRRRRVSLALHPGENPLFMRMQASCARNTRIVTALRMIDSPDLCSAYPGEETEELRTLQDADAWLSSVRWDGEALIAPHAPPVPLTMDGSAQNPVPWPADNRLIPAEGIRSVTLIQQIGDTRLTRLLEISSRIRPELPAAQDSLSASRAAYRKRLANMTVPEKFNIHSDVFFITYGKLAEGQSMDAVMENAVLLECRESLLHYDCSDFSLSYMLKALYEGLPMTQRARDAIRESALQYSYWTDEPAIGAMCYWSENHALTFHVCQLIAGLLWPDSIFQRSGRTGRQQQEIARERIAAWMDKVEKRGFEEFLSGVYTAVTVVSLLAVYDCAGGELTLRAGKLLDKIFYDLALNAFDDIVCAPQGRIYRTALTPWVNTTQALYHYATGRGPAPLNKLMSAFCRTGYRIPDDVGDRARTSGMISYDASGTKIQICKSEGFMLTSLPLPLEGDGAPGPYIPGKPGVQQHLFYACFGGAANLFLNHPGASHDLSALRPGYWYGNGYLPAVKQNENLLAAVCRLHIDHPIPYVHLYFPEYCFDEVLREGNWLFARRGSSYAAVWCSRPLVRHDADITQGVDFRAEGGSSAWLIVCGDRTISPDFASFREYALSQKPIFDEETMHLHCAGISLQFREPK